MRPAASVAQLSLEEFLGLSTAQKNLGELEVDASGSVSRKKALYKSQKRARQLQEASVLVVDVKPTEDVKIIDNAVVSAIQEYKNVVLTASRSIAEVKYEKASRMRKLQKAQEAVANQKNMGGRRRLEEDADQRNADNAQEDQENDMSGVVYVHMTPNILAGLLFFFLFSVIAYIGVTCMNMISGQDVYVKKMPSIGREA